MKFFAHLIPDNPEYLHYMDASLQIVHLSLILFVMFGAFFRRVVPYHFPVLLIIWLSWSALGYYVGYVGYCPLTDWHWQVKWREGEEGLPPSYIEYCYTYFTGQDVDDKLMSNIIAGVMAVISLFSAYRFFRWWKKR